MAGIIAGNVFPDIKIFVFPAIFVLFFLLCTAFYYNKKLIFPVILCLIFCFGILSIQFKLYPELPSHHISNFLDSKKIKITGRVASFARHYEKKSKRTLLCQTLETKDGLKIRVTGRITLNTYGFLEKNIRFADNIRFGDIIQFESSIRSIRNFMNPGAFDYEKFLRFKAVFGSAYADPKKIKILTRADQLGIFSQLLQKIETVRTNYYRFIMKDPGKTKKILASLITGKKEIISQDIRDLFSKVGISHLLAISGLHLSIVSILFFSFFYGLLSYIPMLLIDGRSKKIAGTLSIAPLILYAVFSGFSPSTQRALIMIIVLLFSFISEKEKDILSSLSMAGILILIIDSSALFSISFQLSFAAVTFIIYGVSLFEKFSFMYKKNLFSKIALMMIVTFFAGIGTLPLTAHYFNIVSAIALISNLIAIPLLGFIVLPLGLISLVCFPYFPLFSNLIINGCSQLISFLFIFSEFLVAIPYSWSRIVTLQWTEITIIYLVFLSIFFLLKRKIRVAVFILTLSFILISYNFANDRFEKLSQPDLNITILDVGQGSCAFIQTPEGKNILVDGGGFSDNSLFDTGRFIVAPFLWQKRIRYLDYVILTHPESDHLNGLIFILQNFQVHTLIKNADEKNSKNYMKFMNTSKKRNVKIWNPLNQGKSIDFGTTRLLFYGSSKEFFLNNFNNNSLVFKVIYNDFSMLFPGDILMQREENLSSKNKVELRSDILLSPHHGSYSSSTKIFLDKVQPKSVIISCGWHNRYGFPHHMILKRYKKRGISLFRTDENGAIFIASNGKNYTIKTFKGE